MFDFLDGSEAYRGCMSDPIENGRDFCMANLEHCIRCKDRACNSQKLEFEKPLACVQCTPNENDNCKVIDKNTTAIKCAPTVIGYKNYCYTYHKEQTVTRGCLYEASDSIFDTCKTNTSASCTICNQTDCNRAPITNATIPLNNLNFNNSERGKSHSQVTRPKKGENRLHCYRCNGTEECDLKESFFWRPTPCGIPSKYDRCFTFIQHKGENTENIFNFQCCLLNIYISVSFYFVDQKIYRGCLSDSSDERLMCDLSQKYKLGFCDICSGSGCNNQPKEVKPKLSCLKCNDEKSCALAQNASDAKPCQKNVLFGDKESCFTYQFKSN